MESRKPLVVADTKNHSLCSANRSLADKPGIKSIVGLPLLVNDWFRWAMTPYSSLDVKQIDDRGMYLPDALARDGRHDDRQGGDAA